MSEPNAAAPLLRPVSDLPYARPMTEDDTALMLRYAAGDSAAFEPLYRRHNDAVYRYLLRACGNSATAEELAQEVWTKLIRARERYQPSAKFRTFLFRIAHNAHIDHIRRHRGQEVEFADELAACDGPQPDGQSERAELRQRFQAALASLPVDQRDAWLLHEEAGLSVEQVAAATGVNRETAKSRIRYAVRKLKDRLAAELQLEHV